MIRSLLVAALLLAASPAAAQVDFIRQDIVVDLTSSTLRVELELEVRATDSTDGIWVLTPSLPVLAATIDDVAATTIVHPDSPIATGFLADEDLPIGESSVFRITLEGTPRCSGAPYDVCAYDSDTIALFPNSPGFAWYLTSLQSYDDTYVGSVRVRAPDVFVVAAAQGAAASVEAVGDGTSWWTYDITTPATSTFVYASTGEQVSLDVAGRTLLGFSGPSPDAMAAARLGRTLEVIADILPIYERHFGAMPVDEVHVLSVPSRFAFGGMGLLGNIIVGDFIFSDQYAYLLEQGMAHELAHSWWGNIVSATAANEGLLMQEGMAEYSAWLALGEAWGDDVRTSGARMNAVWYMYGRPGDADVAALDPSLGDSPVAVHVGYHKGAQAWRAIATAAGEERFLAALATLIAAGGSTSVDDLSAALLAQGYDGSRDVDQWLRATGFPTLEATSTISEDQLCISVAVTGDYDLSLPIELRLADGSTQEHMLGVLAGANQECLPAVENLAAVELDPRWTMVRQVRPTLPADVTLDGRLDAADLMAVALQNGTAVPTERRRDGGYDPLYDVDADRDVDADDLRMVAEAVARP